LTAPSVTFDEKQNIVLGGEWVLAHAALFPVLLNSLHRSNSGTPVLDARSLTALDTCGAAFLKKIKEQSGIAQLEHLDPRFRKLLALVEERSAAQSTQPCRGSGMPRRRLIARIGAANIALAKNIHGLLDFLGRVFSAFNELIHTPRRFRHREFATQIESLFVNAIPVVCLVTFLIGMVVAYLSAIQLERYGATIFLVDGIALSMCRELAPVIAAIIMAGRSGSAFTAQLGTMKLNEEIDALQVLGLSPFQVLVLPRVLAFILTMPLLVFIGDVFGIFGGFFVGNSYLNISATAFFERLQVALPLRHVWVGLIKAPIFAATVAVIGCRMGLTVENNARSIGLHTTSTVVQSIVAVILLNAGFAIIFQKFLY
jgi:phospholipid/cholesterol/gamma-HCH transport system permease protein